MPTSHNGVLEESGLKTAVDLSVSHGRHFRANTIIIMGNAYALFYS